MIILACILARFNFQDHVNLRSAHSGCSSTVYIVQLACLEHAESTRRSRDDSVLMRRVLFPAEFENVPRAVNWNQHNGLLRKRAWTLFGTYPDLDSRFLPGIYQVPWPSTAMRLRGCHWHDQGVPSPMFMRNSATQNIDLCILLSVNPSLIFSGLARAFSTFSCFNFVSGCSAIANVWDQDASSGAWRHGAS